MSRAGLVKCCQYLRRWALGARPRLPHSGVCGNLYKEVASNQGAWYVEHNGYSVVEAYDKEVASNQGAWYVEHNGYSLVEAYGQEWPKFSGCVEFPIGGSKAYNGELWEGENGEQRREFCRWLMHRIMLDYEITHEEVHGYLSDYNYTENEITLLRNWFRDVQDGHEQPHYKNKGVCHNSDYALAELTGTVTMCNGKGSEVVQEYMQFWPGFTGDFAYPICGKDEYYNQWEGEKGELRREFCGFLADCLTTDFLFLKGL